nr:type III PLP-dependent enzyme [Candidatus Sigynarchaeota archaeon]
MNNTELHDLALIKGTPLMVIDHARIRQNFQDFRRMLPRVFPYFAIKANPEVQIARTLAREGSGFDIASWEEFTILRRALQGNKSQKWRFLNSKVIYANTIKNIESLDKMREYSIPMTFDNPAELDKIAAHCNNLPLILRIDVPNHGSVVELSSKFGARYEDCQSLLKHADQLHLHVIGVSFHVGSQCEDPHNFVAAFERARQVFDDAKHAGHELSLLDIGGGFPAPYSPGIQPFAAYAAMINSLIDKYFPSDTISIVAEPGRYFVATAATSIASVIGKSIRDGKPYYYINDGVYHTFSGFIYDHIQYHFKAFHNGKAVPSVVAGPTCDALDTISRDELLPDLAIGDLVYSDYTGAYTNASASNFNGFPPAKIAHINVNN